MRTRATARFPLHDKGETSSHVSASRPDLHGNRRLTGESLRAKPSRTSPCRASRPARRGTTHGELVSTTGARVRGTTGLTTGSPAPPATRAHRPVGIPLRPPTRLRSLPPGPMHAPAARPSRGFLSRGAAAAGAKPGPCLGRVRSHRERGFKNGFYEWFTTGSTTTSSTRASTRASTKGSTTDERLCERQHQRRVQRVNGIIGMDLFP